MWLGKPESPRDVGALGEEFNLDSLVSNCKLKESLRLCKKQKRLLIQRSLSIWVQPDLEVVRQRFQVESGQTSPSHCVCIRSAT